ncbi:sentrin-specific protease 1-like, partial [Melanaphis sacchari]|uniref:sentrin-specific protease 1-like n=1 Tax=Melanaphis sacchari TaxID=742174 RepID=UPI000DC1460C
DTNNVIVSNDEVNNTVNLLDSFDDEDNSETSKLALPKVSEVKNLNKIVFIPTPWPIKIFPGYNEEVLNKLKNFVANKTLQDLVHTNENKLCPIRIDDLLRVFMPDNWLNDLVIQYYLELLINSSKNKILNLTSFFMESIKTHNKVPEKCYKNKNIFSYDKIIVPVFNNNHWTLIVVDIRAREIIHFNSFDFILHNEISIMKLFLKLAYEDQKQPGDEDEIFWTDCNGNSPIQNNQNDCGVFICTNARYRLLDKPSNFSQEDIPLLRQRITYEIVYNILLPT